jgi:transcriptional regulator with XRE-family HTH domain
MTLIHEPIVEQRRLRTRLRAAREKIGKTQLQAAQDLGWPREKVLRIEKGSIQAQPGDVRALASLYNLQDPEVVNALIEMSKIAKLPGWNSYSDIFNKDYINYLGLEAVADKISQIHPSLVPGLLQTQPYAEEILKKAHRNDSPHRIARMLEARLLRQEILQGNIGPAFTFIIDEAALRHTIGSSEVMNDQIDHLRGLVKNTRLTLLVAPFESGAHPGLLGPFIHLDLSTEGFEDVVFLENPHGDSIIKDDQQTTSDYAEVFQALVDLSVPLVKFLQHDGASASSTPAKSRREPADAM